MGARAQRLQLLLYGLDLAVSLGPQQHSEQAGNTQSGAFGSAASVSLIQQYQVGGDFQR